MRVSIIYAVMALFVCSYADNDMFHFYGFADMSITKYFPKEKSFSMGIDRMDEKAYFGLDHVNLYANFQPNSKLRFLTELSFQDRPADYLNTVGNRYIMAPIMDTTYSVAEEVPENKIQKGIVNYEWGSFSVERAFFTLNLNRYFNLSFGKFITPAGIWNVDHGSPVIMTIMQPNEYSMVEIFPKSQLGIMEEGKIFPGDADLSYSLYLSSGRKDQPIHSASDLSVGGQIRFGLPLLDELNLGISGYTGKVNTKLRTCITVLTYNPITNGVSSDATYSDSTKIEYREEVFGVDMKVQKWRTTFQTEFNYQYIDDYLKSNSSSKTIGSYFILSVDAYKAENLKITPYGYYERVKYFDPENNPKNGGFVVSKGYHKFLGGINFRAFTNYGIKLEYNFTRIDMPSHDPDGLADIPGVGAQFYIAF